MPDTLAGQLGSDNSSKRCHTVGRRHGYVGLDVGAVPVLSRNEAPDARPSRLVMINRAQAPVMNVAPCVSAVGQSMMPTEDFDPCTQHDAQVPQRTRPTVL